MLTHSAGFGHSGAASGMPWALLALALVYLAPFPAEAFCLHNDTDERLYFMVEPLAGSGGEGSLPSFGFWIAGGAGECRDWRDPTFNRSGRRDTRLSFYAFIDPEALEGCDVFATADSEVRLREFEEFDRCVWR